MCPAKKVPPNKKHKQTQNWIMLAAVIVLIVILVTVAYVVYPTLNKPKNTQTNNQPNQNTALDNELNSMPAGFKPLAEDYLNVMKNLNSSQTKAEMLTNLNPHWNQTDLFTWESGKMSFANDPAGSFEDPFQILSSGDGICVQWSIVYVSACLALGYQSRLVVAVDTQTWSYIHVWAEDYYNGTWVPVDPSDKAWNDGSVYQTWDWGSGIGTTVHIFAFEDGSFQDVTPTYSAPA